MNITQETIDKLRALYPYFSFRRHKYDFEDIEPSPEEATVITIGMDLDGNYMGFEMVAPKNKEVTFDYIMNKINEKSVYKNFTEEFNKLIRKHELSAYPTTYGIGVFSFRHDSLEKNTKIDEILNSLGIKYSKEFSDAHYVLRYKISKASINMEKVKSQSLQDNKTRRSESMTREERLFELLVKTLELTKGGMGEPALQLTVNKLVKAATLLDITSWNSMVDKARNIARHSQRQQQPTEAEALYKLMGANIYFDEEGYRVASAVGLVNSAGQKSVGKKYEVIELGHGKVAEYNDLSEAIEKAKSLIAHPQELPPEPELSPDAEKQEIDKYWAGKKKILKASGDDVVMTKEQQSEIAHILESYRRAVKRDGRDYKDEIKKLDDIEFAVVLWELLTGSWEVMGVLPQKHPGFYRYLMTGTPRAKFVMNDLLKHRSYIESWMFSEESNKLHRNKPPEPEAEPIAKEPETPTTIEPKWEDYYRYKEKVKTANGKHDLFDYVFLGYYAGKSELNEYNLFSDAGQLFEIGVYLSNREGGTPHDFGKRKNDIWMVDYKFYKYNPYHKIVKEVTEEGNPITEEPEGKAIAEEPSIDLAYIKKELERLTGLTLNVRRRGSPGSMKGYTTILSRGNFEFPKDKAIAIYEWIYERYPLSRTLLYKNLNAKIQVVEASPHMESELDIMIVPNKTSGTADGLGKVKKKNVELKIYDARDKFNVFDLVTNNRFIYNPNTQQFLIGGDDIDNSSHAQEFHDAGMKGNFDDCFRGWIGISKSPMYKDGIVHFSPPVWMTKGYDNYNEGAVKTLEMFMNHGVKNETVIRSFNNFDNVPLEKFDKLLSGGLGELKTPNSKLQTQNSDGLGSLGILEEVYSEVM